MEEFPFLHSSSCHCLPDVSLSPLPGFPTYSQYLVGALKVHFCLNLLPCQPLFLDWFKQPQPPASLGQQGWPWKWGVATGETSSCYSCNPQHHVQLFLPHLGPATYLPIWNTTPLKLESRVDICLLSSVSEPRDLFLLPPLPLFCLRRVLCICSFLGSISLCYLQCSVEVHELMVLALMLTAVWSVWPKAPHSLQSLPEKLDPWAHSALPQQGSCCCLSSLVKQALAAEAEGTACRVSWVAITWSLLIF